MSDDWQVGDLALCVTDGRVQCGCGRFHANRHAPCSAGQVLEVTDVTAASAISERSAAGGCHCATLVCATGVAGLAIRFRKIRPLSDEERDSFEAELREPTRAPAVRLREMKASYHREENDRGR